MSHLCPQGQAVATTSMRDSRTPLVSLPGHGQADMVSCPPPGSCSLGVNGESFSQPEGKAEPGKGWEWQRCPRRPGPSFVLTASCALSQSRQYHPGGMLFLILIFLMGNQRPKEIKGHA